MLSTGPNYLKSIGDVLGKIQLGDQDKYLSREFQKYGIYLTEQLGDMTHKSLYIRMAKEVPRQILAEALSFVLDAQAKSKARLFMWKVKQLKVPFDSLDSARDKSAQGKHSPQLKVK